MINAIHELPENQWTYLINFEPNPETGYSFNTDNHYKTIENIISDKTNSDGHSGSSFAVCMRCAVENIRTTNIVECVELINE
jgi:hypothetical protein